VSQKKKKLKYTEEGKSGDKYLDINKIERNFKRVASPLPPQRGEQGDKTYTPPAGVKGVDRCHENFSVTLPKA
jgi:hypothetical protein